MRREVSIGRKVGGSALTVVPPSPTTSQAAAATVANRSPRTQRRKKISDAMLVPPVGKWSGRRKELLFGLQRAFPAHSNRRRCRLVF